MRVEELIKNIGFETDCVDSELFELAMTHASYSMDNNLGVMHNNERLEFYGDAVLKLAASKFLYNKYPDKKEGVLSSYRAILVSDAYLTKYAEKISLQDYLNVSSRSDLKRKKAQETLLACAFEALLGAMFIQFGFDKVNDFLSDFFLQYSPYVEENLLKINAKSTIQEYLQAKTKQMPIYVTKSVTGKGHDAIFNVELYHQDELISCAAARTKKEAEQLAAYNACVKLGVINE